MSQLSPSHIAKVNNNGVMHMIKSMCLTNTQRFDRIWQEMTNAYRCEFPHNCLLMPKGVAKVTGSDMNVLYLISTTIMHANFDFYHMYSVKKDRYLKMFDTPERQTGRPKIKH